MEKKKQYLACLASKLTSEEFLTFGAIPAFFCSHMAWMIAMFLDIPLLIKVTLGVLLACIGAEAILYGYAYFSGRLKISFGNSAVTNEPPVIRKYCQLMMMTYLGTLMAQVLACQILPESLMWVAAFVPALACVAVIGLTVYYVRLYRHGSQEPAEGGMSLRHWEKYWSYLMVSDNFDLWMALTAATYLLGRGLREVLADPHYLLFCHFESFLWFMGPLVIAYELNKLSHQHEKVIASQPRKNRVVEQSLGLAALIPLLLMPWLRRWIYASLVAPVADTVFLALCIVLASVVVGMAVYFRIYKSKYLKAETLSW